MYFDFGPKRAMLRRLEAPKAAPESERIVSRDGGFYLCEVPARYLLKGDAPLEKISEASFESIAVGPEESVEYDFMEGGFVYGAPIGDPTDPNHPKDKDGNLMRKRSKILGRFPIPGVASPPR